MKTILFIIPFLSGGGAERVVSIWASELVKLGEQVHLLVFFRTSDEYSLDGSVLLRSISPSKEEHDGLPLRKKLFAIRRALKEIRPDVVIPFLPHVGLLVAAARLGLPVTVIETIRNDPHSSPEGRLLRWLRNLSVALSRRCIVQTGEQLRYFPRWLRRRMAVFANPVSNEFCEACKEFGEKKIRKIIAAGRLVELKNYPLLIRAFTGVAGKDKSIELDIYGEGPLRNALEAMISQAGLQDRARLRGRGGDMAEALLHGDLYVLSSSYEGMPNSLMEAMAEGLPCISTDCPTGPADLIVSGVNGLLVPAGDAPALERAMLWMIGNADIAVEMGRRARKTILGRHSAIASATALRDFIESIQ